MPLGINMPQSVGQQQGRSPTSQVENTGNPNQQNKPNEYQDKQQWEDNIMVPEDNPFRHITITMLKKATVMVSPNL